MKRLGLVLFAIAVMAMSGMKAQNIALPLLENTLETSGVMELRKDSLSKFLRQYLFVRANPEKHYQLDTVSYVYKNIIEKYDL